MVLDNFIRRHIGPSEEETKLMLKSIGAKSLDDLIDRIVPAAIKLKKTLRITNGMSEYEYLMMLKEIAAKNKVFKSYIGQGYYYSICPAVVTRNIFENPSWYTSYTPYQAEISQGRLEALLNFQTMIMDLTKMEIANASLLDEATAAAEAMIMFYNIRTSEQVAKKAVQLFVDSNTFAQTIDVLRTRSAPLGIELVVGDYKTATLTDTMFGCLVQYPAGDGKIEDYRSFVEKAHQKNKMCIRDSLPVRQAGSLGYS